MILLIARRGHVATRWRTLIQRHHFDNFDAYMQNVEDHWWFVDTVGNAIAGIAGAKPETKSALFLGPCVVFPEFRGRGIQREFIRARERLGRQEGFEWAVSYTSYQNYASSNNFVQSGYRLAEPWEPTREKDGIFLYWRKRL